MGAAPAQAATAPASTTPAQPEVQPSPPPAAAAAAAPETLVSPVVEAARRKLSDKSLVGRDNLAPDVAAAADFYNAHKEPLWIHDGSYNEKAKSVISDLKKADDWGLESSDFIVPNLASNADADAQGAAEVQLTLSALKYARFARGGRLDPVSLSNILDMKPPVKDPKVVLRELAEASHPGPFLRGLNPHHDGFEKLRQELLKARGATVEEEPADPVEQVKLPRGKLLRLGVRDDQVALLRQRLKVPSESPETNDLYDQGLQDAVKDYQRANGLNPDGLVGNGVRNALNGGSKSKRIDPSRNVDRLIANMERWRWLPENLGSFHVWNNIPEYRMRVLKDGALVHSETIIVGKPSTPTPQFSADMKYVIFHPTWGVPDGIKVNEIAPALRRSSSNNSSSFWGGGSTEQPAVLRRYNLIVSQNGRQVDPNSVNWQTVDVRNFQFTQPASASNVLGVVKFRFPNKHDVYMHDTPDRGLFSRTEKAFSHGCMRVQNPRRLAEVLLAEDRGWSSAQVGSAISANATQEVTLAKQIPVHVSYFTAIVDDEGQLHTFADLYGHDNRVASALDGRPIKVIAQSDPAVRAEREVRRPVKPRPASSGGSFFDLFSGLAGN